MDSRVFNRRSSVFHILTIALLACGGTERKSDNVFRVALLTPGPVTDQSWNGGAYAGLMRIKDSLQAQVSHIQTKTPAEFEENFRQYGASGYNLVFGHGFEFQDAAARVSPSYPKTIYITTGGNTTGKNLAAMSFSFDEPSFLAGMVAASVTKSGIVGCIGGTELPPVKSSFTAFAAGVHAVKPTATIVTAFIGNWDDAAAGKEQALAQISRGADVIFQNADAAGLGVFQAVRESKGVYVIGSNSDQNTLAPSVTLGSVVIDLPHAFITVAREVKQGHFVPRIIDLGTKDDVVRWVPNPALPTVLTPSARKSVDSVRTLMLSGTFTRSTASVP